MLHIHGAHSIKHMHVYIRYYTPRCEKVTDSQVSMYIEEGFRRSQRQNTFSLNTIAPSTRICPVIDCIHDLHTHTRLNLLLLHLKSITSTPLYFGAASAIKLRVRPAPRNHRAITRYMNMQFTFKRYALCGVCVCVIDLIANLPNMNETRDARLCWAPQLHTHP